MSPMNKTESLRSSKKKKKGKKTPEMRSNVYLLHGSYDLQAG